MTPKYLKHTLGVPNLAALCACEDDWQRVVVVGGVGRFSGDGSSRRSRVVAVDGDLGSWLKSSSLCIQSGIIASIVLQGNRRHVCGVVLCNLWWGVVVGQMKKILGI